MEEIKDFFANNIWLVRIIYSILVIIASTIIYKLIVKIISNSFNKSNIKNNKKAATYIKLSKSILRYVVLFIVIIFILKLYGVNVTSMLAGIGIISVIIGLAIQDFLKDIIRGTTIISDEYFSVGDVIKYKNIEGKVLELGLKTTKIQDIANGDVHSIANRNIEEVAISSIYLYVRVPLQYELKLDEQRKVVKDIINLIKKDKLIANVENLGLTELADSKIEYLLRITTNPINKYQVRRNANEYIVEGLEKNNLTVPYNQLDVHQK